MIKRCDMPMATLFLYTIGDNEVMVNGSKDEIYIN